MFDNLETRCPRLGHVVKFCYCRQEGGMLPCTRVIQCWQGIFPVTNYLENLMDREKLEVFLNVRPKEKIVSILEIVESVRKRYNDEKG
ncbi:MAG: hypothetical protein N2317_05415 [Syntrophales bacterium]|nr:hypothetical protein [Syntrophales bacterium]